MELKGYCPNCGKYQPMVRLAEFPPPPTVWVCPMVYYAGECQVCGHPAVLFAYELKYSRDCMGEFLLRQADSYRDFLWEQLPWWRRVAWLIARCFLALGIGR